MRESVERMLTEEKESSCPQTKVLWNFIGKALTKPCQSEGLKEGLNKYKENKTACIECVCCNMLTGCACPIVCFSGAILYGACLISYGIACTPVTGTVDCCCTLWNSTQNNNEVYDQNQNQVSEGPGFQIMN